MPTFNGQKRAVFFDAGLTLIYSEMSLTALCMEAASANGIDLAPTQVDATLGKAAAHLLKAHRKDPHLWSSDERVHRLWLEYYVYIFNELGIYKEAQACAAEVYASYTRDGAWSLFPDVLPTLEELHRRGYLLGVISDWASNLPSGILLPLGIGRYVDFVVVSTIQREAKPDMGLYREALARARVQPHEAIHIGDNYINDVLGARAAGIDGIFLDRYDRHTAPLDCLRIGSLAELPDLLG